MIEAFRRWRARRRLLRNPGPLLRESLRQAGYDGEISDEMVDAAIAALRRRNDLDPEEFIDQLNRATEKLREI